MKAEARLYGNKSFRASPASFHKENSRRLKGRTLPPLHQDL
ncbi:hypothetical protein AtDm6_2218 [Acetobacter tropicalis]|uniref:Uncharacterized protein n=2 Tax=Acetobacter tropicalis TaxID=104102 RepID=F7VE94_9PROT|nr:hypothetical protein AtDm6_2218 [Acetobacter tropicalis]GAA08689.1 hypothetical protein ATPR_1693 [Acetobacter tropicalis NBRC 101654]